MLNLDLFHPKEDFIIPDLLFLTGKDLQAMWEELDYDEIQEFRHELQLLWNRRVNYTTGRGSKYPCSVLRVHRIFGAWWSLRKQEEKKNEI